MAYHNRSSKYLGQYLRSSLFLNGYTQSPNNANPAGRVYLGLYQPEGAQPFIDDNEWVELSGTNYAREQVDLTYNSTDVRVEYKTSSIQFNTAGSDWGTAGAIGISDSLSGGNLLVVSPIQEYGNDWYSINLPITSGHYFEMPNGVESTIANENFDWYQGNKYLFTTGTTGRDYTGALTKWVYNIDSTLKDAGGASISRQYYLAIGRYTGNLGDVLDSYGRLTSWIECSGQDYTPQLLTYSDWEAATDYTGDKYSAIWNTNPISFTTYATNDWGLINMWVLYPTSHYYGSKLIAWWGLFSTPVNVTQGMSFGIFPNYLTVLLTY